jgi:two-component system cell cycle response regulator DivK
MLLFNTDCVPMIGRSAKEKPAVSERNRLATVLYIEDDRPSRVLVRRVLEAEGFRVLEAIDGPEGLDVAQTERPELILVDINMPEMDGFEVTARLRALPELGTVPIIALTANVMKGDRERTLAAGCSGYIQKPIDVDLLPVQLAAFLRW